MKKKKIKKIIIPILMILVGIIMLIYLIRDINNKEETNSIIGEWTTDGVTIYEFNEDNTGKLKVSLGEYDFDYIIKEDKISIDFINEKSEDSEYTYTLNKDKLVLKGKNGTFKFKRK